MSKGKNLVILIGHLGADPEVRRHNGVTYANLSLATTESKKNADTGEWEDFPEWHRVTLSNRIAEVAEQYLRKGSQVYIEGRLRTRKWQDKDGNDRWTTEIVTKELLMLGSKDKGNADNFYSAPPVESYQPEHGTQPEKLSNDTTPDPFDDDMPF